MIEVFEVNSGLENIWEPEPAARTFFRRWLSVPLRVLQCSYCNRLYFPWKGSKPYLISTKHRFLPDLCSRVISPSTWHWPTAFCKVLLTVICLQNNFGSSCLVNVQGKRAESWCWTCSESVSVCAAGALKRCCWFICSLKEHCPVALSQLQSARNAALAGEQDWFY